MKEMNDAQAVVTLRVLRDDRLYLIKATKRKRWRDSEKAMAIAKYNAEYAALDRAIGALQYRIDNMPQIACS